MHQSFSTIRLWPALGALFLALFCSSVAPSAQAQTVSGRVSDQANGGGNPLPDTTITIESGVVGAQPVAIKTDQNGNYSFTYTSGVGYTITPSKSGYIFNPQSNSIFSATGANFSNQNFIATPVTVQFGAAGYSVGEGDGRATITITRTTPDLSPAATVNYATVDDQNTANCDVVNGAASARCDYLTTTGTLRFAPGENQKTFTVPIVDDSYADGAETLQLTLRNPAGAFLGAQSTATLTINDNEASTGVNPIGDATFFVRQHYLDFLAREPDAPGLGFWVKEISICNGDAACVDRKRINTSGAFFLSTEFQTTGYFVYRLYKGALNRPPTYAEFLPDQRQIGTGIVVNDSLSDQAIENNKNAFTTTFVNSTEFLNAYPTSMSPTDFLNKLSQITGIVIPDPDRATLINGLSDGSETRVTALRKVLDGTTTVNNGQLQFTTAYGKAFYDKEFNPAFVLQQYFGYLRRDPDAGGYQFWLEKLNRLGNFTDAEMVKSFLLSPEYRTRFGPLQ